MDNLYEYFDIVSAVVTLATAVTVITPTRSDNQVVDFISQLINFLAGNFGRNRNADDT